MSCIRVALLLDMVLTCEHFASSALTLQTPGQLTRKLKQMKDFAAYAALTVSMRHQSCPTCTSGRCMKTLTLIAPGACRTLSEYIHASTTSRAVPRSCITTQAESVFQSGDSLCRTEVVDFCFGSDIAVQQREACACRCQQCDFERQHPFRSAGI